MRNAVVMFASALLAVVGALLAYHQLVIRKDQDALLSNVRVESEATRRQVQQVAKQQEQIRKTLDEAKAQTEADAAEREAYVDMRSDFVVASAMRTAIAEYYMTTSKLPASNAEAGLPAPNEYRGKSLRAASVQDGAIQLVFDASSGVDGGRISLTPQLEHANAMGIQWRCESDDYPQIRRILPSCSYTGAADASTQSAVHAPSGS